MSLQTFIPLYKISLCGYVIHVMTAGYIYVHVYSLKIGVTAMQAHSYMHILLGHCLRGKCKKNGPKVWHGGQKTNKWLFPFILLSKNCSGPFFFALTLGRILNTDILLFWLSVDHHQTLVKTTTLGWDDATATTIVPKWGPLDGVRRG